MVSDVDETFPTQIVRCKTHVGTFWDPLETLDFLSSCCQGCNRVYNLFFTFEHLTVSDVDETLPTPIV